MGSYTLAQTMINTETHPMADHAAEKLRFRVLTKANQAKSLIGLMLFLPFRNTSRFLIFISGV